MVDTATVLLSVVVAVAVWGLTDFGGLRTRPTALSLAELRDAGAKKFVRYVLARLLSEAARGRSDYEFHFRSYDVCFVWTPLLRVFAFPFPARFWDCIDSQGSRDVIKALLEEPGSGLRVEWSIHIDYPKRFAPKWVLSCRWDRLDLTRRNTFGGR